MLCGPRCGRTCNGKAKEILDYIESAGWVPLDRETLIEALRTSPRPEGEYLGGPTYYDQQYREAVADHILGSLLLIRSASGTNPERPDPEFVVHGDVEHARKVTHPASLRCRYCDPSLRDA